MILAFHAFQLRNTILYFVVFCLLCCFYFDLFLFLSLKSKVNHKSHYLYENLPVKSKLLVGNRDDSNRDDKKYANSHLLCFLEAKT